MYYKRRFKSTKFKEKMSVLYEKSRVV